MKQLAKDVGGASARGSLRVLELTGGVLLQVPKLLFVGTGLVCKGVKIVGEQGERGSAASYNGIDKLQGYMGKSVDSACETVVKWQQHVAEQEAEQEDTAPTPDTVTTPDPVQEDETPATGTASEEAATIAKTAPKADVNEGAKKRECDLCGKKFQTAGFTSHRKSCEKKHEAKTPATNSVLTPQPSTA